MLYEDVLAHAGTYDPAKARAYYLRTRELKGRRRGMTKTTTSTRDRSGPSPPAKKTPTQRRGEAETRVAELEARLERLRDVLEELVEAAKKRSGVDTKPNKSEKSSDNSKTNESKKGEKLSVSEKKEAAKRSQEYRDKNPSLNNQARELSSSIEDVQEQIRDARARLKGSIDKARKKSQGPTQSKTASKGR